MTVPSTYFDELYAENPDPWGFRTRWYEERKYALTLAALPLARYRRAFEPGCSIGVLTARLAERCDAVVAMDASPAALASATARVPKNVELVRGAVPGQWPEGGFDLLLVSELAYYLDPPDLDLLVARASASLEPDGHLLAVHWRPKVADYPGDAAEVHRRFGAALHGLGHYEDAFVIIDVFGGPSAGLCPPQSDGVDA